VAEDFELTQVKTIEPTGQQRLYCSGRLLECVAFPRKRKKLLGEQRVAARMLDDVVSNLWFYRRSR
jgi:hypothetical protein